MRMVGVKKIPDPLDTVGGHVDLKNSPISFIIVFNSCVFTIMT